MNLVNYDQAFVQICNQINKDMELIQTNKEKNVINIINMDTKGKNTGYGSN